MPDRQLELKIRVDGKDGIVVLENFDAVVKRIVGTTKQAASAQSTLWQSVKKSATGVMGQFAAANMVTRALNMLVDAGGRAAREFFAIGDALDEAEGSFQKLSRAAGVDAARVLTGMRDASEGLISKIDLLRAANELLASKLPITEQQMIQLTAAAKLLGEAHGVDATQALKMFADGLVRGNDRVLQLLGVDIDLAAVTAELGENASEAAKKHAVLEAVMARSAEQAAKLTDGHGSLYDEIQRGRIALHDWWTELGQSVNHSESLISVLKALKDGIASFGSIVVEYAPLIVTAIVSIGAAILANMGAKQVAAVSMLKWSMTDLWSVMKWFGTMDVASGIKTLMAPLSTLSAGGLWQGIVAGANAAKGALAAFAAGAGGIATVVGGLVAVGGVAIARLREESSQLADEMNRIIGSSAQTTKRVRDLGAVLEGSGIKLKDLLAKYGSLDAVWVAISRGRIPELNAGLDRLRKQHDAEKAAVLATAKAEEAGAKAKTELVKSVEELRAQIEGLNAQYESLTKTQKATIVELDAGGVAAREIAAALGLAEQTVIRYLDEHKTALEQAAAAEQEWLDGLKDTTAELGAMNPIIGATTVGIGGMALQMTEAEQEVAALYDAMKDFGLVSLDQVNQDAVELEENWRAVWQAYEDGQLGADQVMIAWQRIYDFYREHNLALGEDFIALGEKIKASLGGAPQTAATLGDTLRSVLGNAIQSTLDAWIRGAESFKKAFVGIFKQAVAEILKLLLNKTLKNALSNLFSGVSGSVGGVMQKTGIWDRIVGWVGKTFGNSLWGMLVSVIMKLIGYLPKMFSHMRGILDKGGEKYLGKSWIDKLGEFTLRSLPGGNESIAMLNKWFERTPLIAVFEEYGAKLGAVFGESISKGTAEQILALISAAFGGIKGGALEDKIPIGIYLPEVQLLLMQSKLHDLSTQTAEDWARIWTEHTRAVLINDLGKSAQEAAEKMKAMLQTTLDALRRNNQTVGPELANLVLWAHKLGVEFDTAGLYVRNLKGELMDMGRWLQAMSAVEDFKKQWEEWVKNLVTGFNQIADRSNFDALVKGAVSTLGGFLQAQLKYVRDLVSAMREAGMSAEEIAAKLREMGQIAKPALVESSRYLLETLRQMQALGRGTTQIWEQMAQPIKQQLALMRQLGLEGTAAYKRLQQEFAKLKKDFYTIQGVMNGVVGYFKEMQDQGQITAQNIAQMTAMAMEYIRAMQKAGATQQEVMQALSQMYESLKAAHDAIINQLFADWDALAAKSGTDAFKALTDQQKKIISDFLSGVAGAQEKLNDLHLPKQLYDQIMALKEQINPEIWAQFERFYKKQEQLQKYATLMAQINAIFSNMGNRAFTKTADLSKWTTDVTKIWQSMHKMGTSLKDFVSQYGATTESLYQRYIKENKTPPAWLSRAHDIYLKQKEQEKRISDAQRSSQIGLLEALKAIITALGGTVPASLNKAINDQKRLQQEADKTYAKLTGTTVDRTKNPALAQIVEDTDKAKDRTDQYKTKWQHTKEAIRNTLTVGGLFYEKMKAWLADLTTRTDSLRKAFKGSGVHAAIGETLKIGEKLFERMRPRLALMRDLTAKLEKAFKGSGVYSAVRSVLDLGSEFETDLIKPIKDATSTTGELENAWSYFGVKTRAELEQIAQKSSTYFWEIYNSGQATTSVLTEAWKKTAENIIAAGWTLPPEFQAIGDALGISVTESVTHAQTAFELFGVKTRAELEQIAAKTLAAFEEVRNSGALTPEELYNAWQQTRDAMVAAGMTLGEEFKKLGADLETTLKKGETGVQTLANSTHLASVSMVNSFGKTEEAAEKLQKKIDKITKATMALVDAFKIGTETGQINAGNVGSYEQAGLSFLGRLKKAGGSYESILEAAKGFSESLGPLGATAITGYYNTLQAAAPFMSQLGAFQEVVQQAAGKLKKHEFVPIASGLVDIYNRSLPLLGGDTIDYMRATLREINKSEDQYKQWYNDVGGFKALMDAAGFARGIQVVPYDMVAKIHRGEKLVPADVPITTGYGGRVLPWPKNPPMDGTPRRDDRPDDDREVVKNITIPIQIDGHSFGNIVLQVVAKALRRGALDVNVRSISSAS